MAYESLFKGIFPSATPPPTEKKSVITNTPSSLGQTASAEPRAPLPGEQVFNFVTKKFEPVQSSVQITPGVNQGSLQGTATTTPPATPTPPAPKIQAQATEITPANPTAPTVNAPTTPQTLEQNQFAFAMQKMQQKLAEKNALADRRGLLIKSLFDSPPTAEQLATLSPEEQKAITTGDKSTLEFQIRILNQTLQGQNASTDKAVEYLTSAYQRDVASAEKQKSEAMATITDLFKTYDDPAQAVQILKGLYSPEQIQSLKEQGLDIDQLANKVGGQVNTGTPIGEYLGMPTFDTESTNPGVVRATRNNNPGNIKASETTVSYPGVVGIESKPATDGGYFLIFDSAQSGANAQAQLLINGSSYQGVTAEQAMRKYSGGGYGAEAVGLDPNTDFQEQIKDPETLASVVQAIQSNEGYQPLAGGKSAEVNPVDKYATEIRPSGDEANTYDPTINNTPGAVYQDALTYLYEGPTALSGMGLGQAEQVQNYRAAVKAQGAAIAQSLGIDEYQARTLFKANAKAAGEVVSRIAKIDTTAFTLVSQFPRLAQLATEVGNLGIQESDVTAGKAEVTRKFGSVAAGNYIELLQTVRGDYSAMQAAIGGGRGGEYFARGAAEAIPIG
jgi:hypothetical protein